MIPTMIHVCGTFNKWAANANPTMRMMNPMRYVAKDDIASALLVSPGQRQKSGHCALRIERGALRVAPCA